MKPRIYVALSTFAKEASMPLDILKGSGYEFDINPTQKRLSKEQVIQLLDGYDGVVAGLEPYDQEVLHRLPQLKCISRCGVGIDNVNLPAAKEKGIAVLNTPNVVVQPVAELTLSLILDLMRKVTAHTEFMRRHQWERLTGLQLAGKTVGVVGLGRIGRKVAEILKKMDVHVMGYDLFPPTLWAKDNHIEIVGIETLLKNADIVTLHISPDAKHPFVLRGPEISSMKKGSFLVNTARGSLIDEEALSAALKSGQIAGAALDVYSSEPYTGPLCDLPNVVLTPHIATLTYESRAAMETEAVENILKFFKEKGR